MKSKKWHAHPGLGCSNGYCCEGSGIGYKTDQVHLEQVEKLLFIKQCAGDSVLEEIICERAKMIHPDVLNRRQESEMFKASHDWFDNFMKRTCIARLFLLEWMTHFSLISYGIIRFV